MLMFDTEEQEILDAYEAGTLKRSENADEEIALAKETARSQHPRSKNITIRLNLNDIAAIKERARESGIPYQSIISSLVHQYATGKLKLGL